MPEAWDASAFWMQKTGMLCYLQACCASFIQACCASFRHAAAAPQHASSRATPLHPTSPPPRDSQEVSVPCLDLDLAHGTETQAATWHSRGMSAKPTDERWIATRRRQTRHALREVCSTSLWLVCPCVTQYSNGLLFTAAMFHVATRRRGWACSPVRV